MALDIAQIATALADRLGNCPTLGGRVLDFKPIPEPSPPFAYVGWPVPPRSGRLAIEYGMAGTQPAPGAATAYFPIVVVVAGTTPQTAQAALQPFLDASGPDSVIAALNTDETPLLPDASAYCPGVEHLAFNGGIGSALWLVEVITSMA